MKINESELRNIIVNVISEALGKDITRSARDYIKQGSSKGAGFTTSQQYKGLGGLIRQGIGSKRDSNGQMDWESSANSIWEILSKYKNEVRRLTRVYNAITGKQSQKMNSASLEKRRDNAMAKRQWLATQAANGNDYSDTGVRFGAVGAGSSDNGKLEAMRRERSAERNKAANTGQGWLGSLHEGIIGGSKMDDVDEICTNWKKYVGNTDAANKIMAKINEYKGTISQLSAIIKDGIDNGHIRDINAEKRAQMNAARRNGWRTDTNYGQVSGGLQEAIDRAFDSVKKKLI